MTAMSFKPCRCKEAGLTELQGYFNHMEVKQEECIFHRALLVWHFALGGGCAVIQHGPTNGYRIKDECSQVKLNKCKVKYSPCYLVKEYMRIMEYAVRGVRDGDCDRDLAERAAPEAARHVDHPRGRTRMKAADGELFPRASWGLGCQFAF